VPLVVSDAELDEGLDVVERALAEVSPPQAVGSRPQ
jgi:hypothetical protein